MLLMLSSKSVRSSQQSPCCSAAVIGFQQFGLQGIQNFISNQGMRNSFSLCSLSLRHCLQNCSLFSLQDESDDEYCIGTSDCSSASGQHANIFSPVLSVSHNNARKSTTEVKIFKPFNSIIRSYHQMIQTLHYRPMFASLQLVLGAAMSRAFYPAATIYI